MTGTGRVQVSVALATYNGAAYLAEQLDSLAAQTRLPDEIVISDDGSSDATLAIAAGWAAAHPAIAMRILPGRGPGNYTGNFVRAFAACRGDLVFPCDQDDHWLPGKIEAMAAAMADDPGAMVAIHDVEIADAGLVPQGRFKMAMAEAMGGAMRDYNPGMASVIRGSFLAACLSPPSMFTYDNWFHHCARALDAKRLVRRSLALYRHHGGNAAAAESVNAGAGQGALARRLAYLGRILAADRGARDLQSDAAKLAATRAWLAQSGDRLEAAGISPMAQAALDGRLDARAGLLERRIAIRARARLMRAGAVGRLALSGGYAGAGGWRAAVKDLVL